MVGEFLTGRPGGRQLSHPRLFPEVGVRQLSVSETGIDGGLGEVAQVAVQPLVGCSSPQYQLSAAAVWAQGPRRCQCPGCRGEAPQHGATAAGHLTRDGVGLADFVPRSLAARDNRELGQDDGPSDGSGCFL